MLPADRLLEVAAQSDFLVVCSQLTEQTRGMIDRSVFAAMPTHAVLVNIARGEEVDEAALVDAVNDEQIAGAILDVRAASSRADHPDPSCCSTRGSCSPRTCRAWAIVRASTSGAGSFTDNLRRYLDGEPLLNVVDRQRGY